MKHVSLFFTTLLLLVPTCLLAQDANKVSAPEPEFVNSYNILTSDSTFDALPKEDGMISKHQNKFGKFAKIAGAASQLGMAGGMIGLGTSGSLSGVVTGLRVMTTAAGAGQAADAVNTLAGAEGMDIAFTGAKSAYTIKNASNGIRLLIKGENNNYDPLEIYRIVRFKTSKKNRRIQWMEFKPSLIGSGETKKRGYIAFPVINMANKAIYWKFPHPRQNQESTAFFTCQSLRLRQSRSEHSAYSKQRRIYAKTSKY